MSDDKDKEKTPPEDNKEDDDPFADIFGDDQEDDKDNDASDYQDDDDKDTSKDKRTPSPKKQVDVESIVNKRVNEATAIIDRRANINDYLASDAGQVFSQYADQIRKAGLDPRFSGIPVSQLPQLILKPDAYVKVLNDVKKKADDEASDSVIGGSTRKTTLPEELQKVDPLSMSAEEFAALKDNAKRGKYLIKK